MFNLFMMINPDLSKVDKAGITILTIIRRVGYWACIILALMDIVKNLMEGDTKSIWETIAKYTVAFTTLYLLPWLFDLIAAIFK
ncbi:hypothetical protein [Caloramator sp. ALD01]|uniref:hypothetical protein n=1 Tax=Caloramator sp. ALD01 TaxID=1031288 RepID=UPI0004041184|nr:hypothetical protein [Caloramator sp. ALD01]